MAFLLFVMVGPVELEAFYQKNGAGQENFGQENFGCPYWLLRCPYWLLLCHGANRSYWSAFDTTEQWQERIEKMCQKPKLTMSPPQIHLVAAWLAEFAGRQERPTCPNIWAGLNYPDYQAILAFVEEASEKFIGFRKPEKAANARCSGCHEPDRWRSEASRAKSPAEWKQTIMRMVQKRWWGYRPHWGIRPPEAAIIHRYMLEQVGKASPLPAVAESDTADTLQEKARRLRFEGKIDEAEIACRQALALEPQGTLERRVRLELGVLFTQYGIPALTDEMRASRPRRELQH